MRPELRRRKLLMVLESNYPTRGGGGAEGQVRTICRYLHEHGVPVEVVTPVMKHDPTSRVDRVDDVTVLRIPYPQVRLLGGLILQLRLALLLWRKRREYDVIHAHIANNMAAVSCVVGRLLGKTVIVKLTGWLELERGVLAAGWNPVRAVKRAALRKAQYLQATSEQLRERLEQSGFSADRIEVIPNAVDVRRFADAVHEREARTGRPLTAVYVGRLVPEKGLDTLLEAWRRAIPADEDATLLLVGDGEMRDDVDEWIAQQERRHQLRALGPRSDVERYLAEADVGVLPSLYEGLSNTLLEYMASGLPVLGTRVSGTEDFIEPGVNGWLVDAGDVDGMTQSLREIHDSSRSRLRTMGEAAQQRVAARAGIDAVVARLAALYDMQSELAAARPLRMNQP